ncbi:MAG: hypothetical protein RBG1_1C00001G0408 [candidate division Zixibacteria bacterium RBG-1]|nr:MAG: hypothetical protein RBG1_1C00001G0408 [candidate division Zixibacteria bacterium RBG-1]OGC84784.1 MAG: hypothetical protein A2V73_05685 [candidate division Zixibacteria bacterium RBG_19FT_COMBO_42_43]
MSIFKQKLAGLKKLKEIRNLSFKDIKKKGKKVLLYVILFYLVRDLILYVIIPGLIFFSVCGN